MTVEGVRQLCRALPHVTEDVKWGHDLCFCIRQKMFTVVSLEPPHSIAFKCTPEMFAELVERPGVIPAPYMARNMWVQEQELGESLEREELAALVKTSYELVLSKLPKSVESGAVATRTRKQNRTARTRKTAISARTRKEVASPPGP